MAEHQQRLGSRLRAIRRQQGLTLQEVEDHSDGTWKAVVVGSYERGDRAISVAKLARLASFYGVPLRDLLPAPADDNTPIDPDTLPRICLDLTRLEADDSKSDDVIVALNRDRIAVGGAAVMLAVVLHNGLGLALGYGGARLMRLDPRRARTLAIEVGMQNSGLGVALAVKHFSAGAALPGALFSVWHNLSGSVLAWYWRRRQP